MKTVRDIEYFDGVKVLVRVDFNVPIKNEAVVDDFRIRAILPTIDFLKIKGVKIILISHLETIDGDNGSLEPVARYLNKLNCPVLFIKDWKSAPQIIDNQIKNGECVLLENIRFFEGEKKNDPKFAKELASLADIYVNEAFPVSHREHASIVGVPKLLPSYVGLQFEKEVKNISKAFNPTHPFVFILGGAKFSTKLPLIERFADVADTIFIGGALANDSLKARGYNVGESKISDGTIDISKIVSRLNIMLPVDVTIKDRSQKNIKDIGANDCIVDVGARTLELIQEKINQAKFLLWNGPLDPYEDGYVEGTEAVAKMIAEATKKGAESIVGGGDTLAAIMNLAIEDKFTFVSSGGGAMLDFLATGTLPGIDALNSL
ncbi:MAG: phosphoglycerate kinase [Patescibacteria group bacterium]